MVLVMCLCFAGPQTLWGYQLMRDGQAEVGLAAGIGQDMPSSCEVRCTSTVQGRHAKREGKRDGYRCRGKPGMKILIAAVPMASGLLAHSLLAPTISTMIQTSSTQP